MARFLLALAFLIGVGAFVRHQFNQVIGQATGRTPRPFVQGSPPQESRRKCVLCGGTGRAMQYNFSRGGQTSTRACSACNGTGWVDNPLYQR